MKNTLLLVFILCFFFLFSASTISAESIAYDLIPPAGQLQRGQNVNFTITIDTKGQPITTANIGMKYNTQYLQYVSTAPGNTLSTIKAEVQDGGKLLFSGSNATDFSGTGTYAVVTFKIIAATSGSTELCVLYNPETPTQVPQPTALPKTGSINQFAQGATIALALLLVISSSLILRDKP